MIGLERLLQQLPGGGELLLGEREQQVDPFLQDLDRVLGVDQGGADEGLARVWVRGDRRVVVAGRPIDEFGRPERA